jgi:hypothetical protein
VRQLRDPAVQTVQLALPADQQVLEDSIGHAGEDTSEFTTGKQLVHDRSIIALRRTLLRPDRSAAEPLRTRFY